MRFNNVCNGHLYYTAKAVGFYIQMVHWVSVVFMKAVEFRKEVLQNLTACNNKFYAVCVGCSAIFSGK